MQKRNHDDRDVAKKLMCEDYISTSNEVDMAKYRKRIIHIPCTSAGRDFKCEWFYLKSMLIDSYQWF